MMLACFGIGVTFGVGFMLGWSCAFLYGEKSDEVP